MSFFVIKNGNITDFFQISNSLRQGDHLSPYLSVLIMEGLCYPLKRAREEGALPGWNVGGRDEVEVEMEISHFLFTDDTLIFWLDYLKSNGLFELVTCEKKKVGWLL